MLRKLCLSAVAVFLLLSGIRTCQAGLPEFVEAHCAGCHDASTQKAGLNLENTLFPITSKKSALTWELVDDRVARDEMPPRDRTRPAVEECAAFLRELATELRRSSRERQAREGRAAVRRLTRAEYESRVNDLLHIRMDLHSLFPEDAVTAAR